MPANKKMVIQTTQTISAAHYLLHKGPCSRLHGHNWTVTVKITSEWPECGMVMDFQRIKEIIKQYDHTTLNQYLHNPTAENLAILCLEQIQGECPQGERITVTVWESQSSYAKAVYVQEG